MEFELVQRIAAAMPGAGEIWMKSDRLIEGGERLVMALEFVERIAARLPGVGRVRL